MKLLRKLLGMANGIFARRKLSHIEITKIKFG